METKLKYKMKILYNDDQGIIDFLADLHDRAVIHDLQTAIDKDKKVRICFLGKHRDEGLITLIMCNDPFGLREGNNILMLFVHTGLSPLIIYFQNWLETLEEKEQDKRIAVKSILRLLNRQMEEERV
jgi:hypothetical protein